MIRYKVFTAGFPSDTEEIVASSPKEAAAIHFKNNMYLDCIFVNGEFITEELFNWHDFADKYPDLRESDLKYRERPKKESGKKSFWKELFVRFLLGVNYYP